jgi:1-deoxy-D-xylulose-5-phosphate synthase
MLFEAMGFNYLGPINGNNVHKLIKILQNVRNLRGPVFLHIITQKGKGYDLAEKDDHKLHAIGTIDKETGLSLDNNPNPLPKYQDVFEETLLEIFAKTPNIVAITAAMLEGTGLLGVQKKFPARTFDVGIAEGHAVTFAAGIATQGIIPIVAIYSSFLQRAFDNIIHDCALQKLHVIFAIDRAGIVGEDGATHHGVFDISYLRIIPNVIVMAPKDGQELRNMLYSAVYEYKNYCIAIRYPRGDTSGYTKTEMQPIPLGKSEILREGDDICIIAFGRMVAVALDAGIELQNRNIFATVVNARFAKPLDTELFDLLAKKFKKIVTVEEGQKSGGFGSAVLEYFNEKNYKNEIFVIGIGDNFIEHGSIDLLLEELQLDPNNLVNNILKFI